MEKVSIIIPAYNRAELTIRTVTSVLNQTYKNIEIIVVDDGSTDNTAECLADFGSSIRYIRKDNGGACSARNLGINEATGKYVALLDCDDLYYPEKLSKSVQYLENNPDYYAVFTAANFIDSNDSVISVFTKKIPVDPEKLTKELLFSNLFCNSTIVALKECFDKVGLFDEKIFIPADWDMWMRISEQFKIGYIDECLTGYRLTDNYTNANLELAIKESLYVLEKAFHRNKKLSKRYQNRCLANKYSGYGLTYVAAKNFSQARKFLGKSVLIDPVNIKRIIYLILSYLAPSVLHRFVIIRVPEFKYSVG